MHNLLIGLLIKYTIVLLRCLSPVPPGQQQGEAGEALPGAGGGPRASGEDYRGQPSQPPLSKGDLLYMYMISQNTTLISAEPKMFYVKMVI